jgi:HAD superfamily hydrolase (TIGR01484 family)
MSHVEGLRPLQALPLTALRMVRGVLTDIDDTLTCEGRIEDCAHLALQHLQTRGLPVVAITGRPAGWSEPFAMSWPVAAIVAENGAVMLRRDGDDLRLHFAQDAASRASNQLRLRQCASEILESVPGAQLAQDSEGRLTDIAIDHSEFAHLDPAQIEAVLGVMHRHGLKASVSSIHINGWLGDHDKWSGARWAVNVALGLPFDAAQWLYVGDSTNDQLMFEHVPLSVAVANIARFVPRLTVLPAYVTPSERGRGFAELVQRLLAAKASSDQ